LTTILPSVEQDDAAVMLAEAVRIMQKLDEGSISERPLSAPLPRGVISCGDACLLSSAVVLLSLRSYPDLADPEILADAIRSAVMKHMRGSVQ
jgi:hypothetical protein